MSTSQPQQQQQQSVTGPPAPRLTTGVVRRRRSRSQRKQRAARAANEAEDVRVPMWFLGMILALITVFVVYIFYITHIEPPSAINTQSQKPVNVPDHDPKYLLLPRLLPHLVGHVEPVFPGETTRVHRQQVFETAYHMGHVHELELPYCHWAFKDVPYLPLRGYESVLLLELLDILHEAGIYYVLTDTSALGAVRHAGIIPWGTRHISVEAPIDLNAPVLLGRPYEELACLQKPIREGQSTVCELSSTEWSLLMIQHLRAVAGERVGQILRKAHPSTYM
jgi:hypothetical protein